MKNSQQILVATLLFTIGSTLAVPLSEEINSVETVKVEESVSAVVNQNSTSNKTVEKLRQDGDGDGDGADGDGNEQPQEFAQVGQQVGQIITGALGGNIGGIFGGATSFIQEEDTKSGVGNILNSIAKPFNQLLISGVTSGQKFFGITNAPAILVAETTPGTPIAGQSSGVSQPLDGSTLSAQGIAVQPTPQVQRQRVTEAPVLLAPKTQNPDDDDDELRTLLNKSS